MSSTASTPYYHTTNAQTARDEIIRRLSAVGCTDVEFEDDRDAYTVTVRWEHNGRKCAITGSARGWAHHHLTSYPHTSRMRLPGSAYHKQVLDKGQVAVNSILRDYLRCQLAAVETGAVSFEDVWRSE